MVRDPPEKHLPRDECISSAIRANATVVLDEITVWSSQGESDIPGMSSSVGSAPHAGHCLVELAGSLQLTSVSTNNREVGMARLDSLRPFVHCQLGHGTSPAQAPASTFRLGDVEVEHPRGRTPMTWMQGATPGVRRFDGLDVLTGLPSPSAILHTVTPASDCRDSSRQARAASLSGDNHIFRKR